MPPKRDKTDDSTRSTTKTSMAQQQPAKNSENGYFHTAKLIVLRNLWLQKKGLPTVEDEKVMKQHGAE